MSAELYPRFREDVQVLRRGFQVILAIRERGEFAVNGVSSGLADALQQLIEGGCSEVTLGEMAGQSQPGDAAKFYFLLEHFRRGCLVAYEWRLDDAVQLRIEPLSSTFRVADAPAPTNGPFTLSPFTYLRDDSGSLLLERPGATCRIHFVTPASVAWLGDVLLDASHGHDQWRALAELLWRTGFLRQTGRDPARPDSWEFHDRLFHTRSRIGLGAFPKGASYRFDGYSPSPPAIKPPMSEKTLILTNPMMSGRMSQTAPLASVMERRRSTRRANDQRPIEAAQVAELLYRVARVKASIPGAKQELLSRPFPSAGAIHELEFYLVVRLCSGVAAGIYHYNGADHQLEDLGASEESVTAIMRVATGGMGTETPPQCILVLASRLPRLSWKYEGIAYRLSLMNAGVVLQTLYLVATDMNLACCALGNGDSAAFADATGLDPMVETSIAEFAFSSMPEDG